MSREDESRSFPSLMELEEESPNILVGSSPHYSWGRVYGGLVVAQGLRAALFSVDPAFRVHSLHAYFIHGGSSDEPIRYEVDPIRDGRSFTTRRVVALQSSGPILNLSASFQRHEAEAEIQLCEMPAGLPDPESLRPEKWNAYLDNRVIPRPSEQPGHAAAWVRVPGCPPGDPILQACGLAYASDELPTVAAMFAHPENPMEKRTPRGSFFTASLDHALWFHRPARADHWMLHDVHCHGLGGGRGLTIARFYDPEGKHVATLTQECLLRVSR